MATESGWKYVESYEASADLSAKQFFCVELSAANKVSLVNAATDRPVGVLQNKPKSGEAAAVMLDGRTLAVSDGSGTAIAAGDLVGPNGSGKMIKKATDDYMIMGRAESPSSADGIIIDVTLLGSVPGGAFRTPAG